MSKSNFKSKPNNPANQPFNIKGSKNKTKVKSWWNSK